MNCFESLPLIQVLTGLPGPSTNFVLELLLSKDALARIIEISGRNMGLKIFAMCYVHIITLPGKFSHYVLQT